MDQVKLASIIALFAALLLGGCGSSDSVPGHTAAEDKAIAESKNLTPEQQIERIQNSPMPAGAKASMIQKIRNQSGTK